MTKNRERRAVVEFIVGGSGHSHVPASNADLRVVVDTEDELKKIPDLPGVLKIRLGDHETVLTLLERAQASDAEAAAVLEDYRHRPNVYLSAGMAQDPRLGAIAVKDLANSGELDDFFEQIVIRLLEATNGELSLVIMREVNSNAGGMGSRGGPEVGERFRNYVESHTNAHIWQQAVRFGGLTFLPISKQAAANTRDATHENVDKVLTFASPRLTRDIDFVELPLRSEDGIPVRDKSAVRDALAGPLLAARFCDAVTSLLDAREVNYKSDSSFGEIRRAVGQWSASLDQTLLARAAATEYHEQIAEFRKQCQEPDSSVISGVRVELEPIDAPAVAIDDVITAVRRGNARDPVFDRLTNTKVPRFRAAVFVEVHHDQVVAVDEILGGLNRPTKLAEVRDTLRRFSGVVARIEHECASAKEELGSADAALEKQRRLMNDELKRLRSPLRTFERVVSPTGAIRRSTVIFGGLLEAVGDAGRARARSAALNAALEQLKADAAEYEGAWLAQVDRVLEHFIDHRPMRSDAVEFVQLETIYPNLLDVTVRHDRERSLEDGRLKPLLLSAVSRVTLEGIGQMLGTQPNPEDIVAALEHEKFSWRAPMWGGAPEHAEPRHQFIVLPPLTGGDLATLQRLANQRQFAPVLVCAETATAGCCIVALDFYPVTKRAEVEPPIYEHARSRFAPIQRVAV